MIMETNSLPIYDASNKVWNFGINTIDTTETDDVFIEGILFELTDEERDKVKFNEGKPKLLKIKFITDAENKKNKVDHFLVLINKNFTKIMTGSNVVEGKNTVIAQLKASGGLFVLTKSNEYVFMNINTFVVEPGTDPTDPRDDIGSPGTMRVVSKNINWPNKCR